MKNTNSGGAVIKKGFVLDVNVIFSGVLSRKEIYRTLFVFSHVIVVPDYFISEESYGKAESLVKEIDPKDVVYVALAEE